MMFYGKPIKNKNVQTIVIIGLIVALIIVI